jgi:hypothetical protein
MKIEDPRINSLRERGARSRKARAAKLAGQGAAGEV